MWKSDHQRKMNPFFWWDTAWADFLPKPMPLKKAVSPDRKSKGSSPLARPLKGTKMAVFALGELGKSLSRDSDLIKELEAMEVPSHTACAALYSPVDNIVLPPESLAAVPENWIQEKMVPISHVACLYDKPTFNQVLGLLLRFAGNGVKGDE